ncbi:class I SAM-dependent methyltransferase [Mongoliibacter ruber]|uniref:Methyltransferase family protein n=1 Tax=Mongoliibacter ruber TaxID=1750599 RepID=A0A2T0WEN4_9BACT|nr:methyltransferase domain-containing protein [Mongoliibacter ruber]PRY85152.1 methyltransferase family protein [Mongoliibacter ruber]
MEMKFWEIKAYISSILLFASFFHTHAQGDGPGFADLVPFVTTPMEVVDAMMELADVKEGDILYDLGSGDGRIPIEAAMRYGINTIGVEIDADLVDEAQQNAKDKGVENLTTFIQGDLFELDFSDATILVLYLFPDINLKLRPKIWQLPKGTRVISHRFDMGDWRPDEVKKITLEDGKEHVLFFWRVP